MQNKRIAHDFKRIQTNIKKRKKRKCLSFALTFINIKIEINFNKCMKR